MKINNIDISKFKAKQLKVNIQNSKIEISKEWLRSSLVPIELYSNIKFKSISVELYFRGDNRDSILKEISNLVSLLRNKSTLKFDNYSNSYICFLENNDIQPTIRKDRYILALSFLGFEIGDEIVETFNRTKSKVIDVTGNLEVPIKIEITPVIDMIDLTITGVSEDPLIVKNLKGDKTIIIDGIEGTVTQDDINKFADTDMWEFPFLVPGKNNISVSKDTCNITIKYNPRFL
ncbi:phage distal tail protein [Paraclostridium bifermentans]|uniref:phage distal tail protein n=1 Tax=Paraclostridium bifermentans TaxID=1490 RepID=UPI00242ADCA7|nr:phage tail protein [Paraclostridium bifermentans]